MLPEAQGRGDRETQVERRRVDRGLQSVSGGRDAVDRDVHVGSRTAGGHRARLVDGVEGAADGLHRGERIGAVVGRLEDQVAAVVDRGTDASCIRDAIDGGFDLGHGRAAIEVENVVSLVATNLQHHVRSQCATGVGQRYPAWPGR